MTSVTLEEVNGAIMFAAPPTILQKLRLSAGSEVEIDYLDSKILLGTAMRNAQETLIDLIAGSDPAAFERTEEDIE